MTEQRKRKVAILGGGIAGLASAYFLTKDPNWRDEFESITVHQLGWRLGGKCASSRNPDACDRIEEHGIHLFGGFYYNAFAMMKEVYDKAHPHPPSPLATMDQAFLPNNASTMWEFRKRSWKQWSIVQKADPNRKPWEADVELTPAQLLTGAFENLAHLAFNELEGREPLWLEKLARMIGIQYGVNYWLRKQVDAAIASLAQANSREKLGLALKKLSEFSTELDGKFGKLAKSINAVRRAYLVLNYTLTLFIGFIEDDVWTNGFDPLDDQDFASWMKKHGASKLTLESPLPVMHPNILFAYESGDCSRPPTMGAGCLLHWTLLSFSEPGSYAWLFAAGTGETLIAPLYRVLEKEGVKFEFFHKVESLHLNANKDAVESIKISVQAELLDTSKPYSPLTTDPKTGLIGWPHRAHYDQLKEGESLKQHDEAGNPNIESYWTNWRSRGELTLQAGEDFDELVLAISIGALPDICTELIEHCEAWAGMIKYVPAIQTQAVQLWMDPPMTDLAKRVPTKDTNVFIGANYVGAGSAFADLHHLTKWEGWPADNTPGTILYFCGAMPENPLPPPYSDHRYPEQQENRVKWQAAQLLQAVGSPMMPKGTVQKSVRPPGDPAGFNFELLSRHDQNADATNPFSRINQQFFRANIDPTERYVISPPRSTKHRIRPGKSGFSNLKLAGDWTRNGLNVGCVEATVMSASLAVGAIRGVKPQLRGHGLFSVPETDIENLN